MYAGTGGTCSNFSAELWVCVLICVGSPAIRSAELLCSCTGWPHVPCDSSVLTLPPSAVTQTHRCICTLMTLSSLEQNLVLYSVGKKIHHTTFLCSCCSNALQLCSIFLLVNELTHTVFIAVTGK